MEVEGQALMPPQPQCFPGGEGVGGEELRCAGCGPLKHLLNPPAGLLRHTALLAEGSGAGSQAV